MWAFAKRGLSSCTIISSTSRAVTLKVRAFNCVWNTTDVVHGNEARIFRSPSKKKKTLYDAPALQSKHLRRVNLWEDCWKQQHI